MTNIFPNYRRFSGVDKIRELNWIEFFQEIKFSWKMFKNITKPQNNFSTWTMIFQKAYDTFF